MQISQSTAGSAHKPVDHSMKLPQYLINRAQQMRIFKINEKQNKTDSKTNRIGNHQKIKHKQTTNLYGKMQWFHFQKSSPAGYWLNKTN